MAKGEELGKRSFVETETGVRSPFKVEAYEIGFDRDKGDDFTTLRVSMADLDGSFEAHATELKDLLMKIDNSSSQFGEKPQSKKKWRFVPRTDQMGPLPYYTRRFAFPLK